jgi:hypothetical protein
MSIYKIPTGLVPGASSATTYLAGDGVVFFDSTGVLRLGDGRTPGGKILTAGGVSTGTGTSGTVNLIPATTTTLGGIIVGNNLTITTSGLLSAVIGNIDGGVPNSVYGGLTAIDGGSI